MQSENALQTECFTWFWNTYPALRGLLMAIPNGGKRSPREAKRMKHEGLTAGAPDMLFCYNGRAIFLELKTAKGVLSDEQKHIHVQLRRQNMAVHIVRDIEHFKAIINNLI
jgi:hypothetical protein